MPPVRHGKANGRAKITDMAMAEEIRRLHKTEALSYASLAKRYGLSASTVQAVCENRTWKTPPSLSSTYGHKED